MLPLPKLENKKEDIIFRMSFKATNHPVQMYNRIFVSTRALQLAGVDPTSQPSVEMWLQNLYQAYFKIRDATVGRMGQNASQDQMKALITGYCEVLRQDSCVQDYWVTIYEGDAKKCDSRQMNL
jgi:hypothetical protein